MQETYKIEKKDWAAKLMAIVVVVTMVTSTFVLFAPEASARTGSDSYGYSFKDSAESDGPTYAWTDIVSSGTKLLGSRLISLEIEPNHVVPGRYMTLIEV